MNYEYCRANPDTARRLDLKQKRKLRIVASILCEPCIHIQMTMRNHTTKTCGQYHKIIIVNASATTQKKRWTRPKTISWIFGKQAPRSPQHLFNILTKSPQNHERIISESAQNHRRPPRSHLNIFANNLLSRPQHHLKIISQSVQHRRNNIAKSLNITPTSPQHHLNTFAKY